MLGIIQAGFAWILNRIFLEFEKHRASLTTLFNRTGETREMVLAHRIETLKDQLEQARKGAQNGHA